MKYKLYRSFGDLNKHIKQHTLVAVEYGKNIFDVTSALMRAVNDELSNSPEYKNCHTWANAPEGVPSFYRVKRYDYMMRGVVSPPNAPENILIDFGIIETEHESYEDYFQNRSVSEIMDEYSEQHDEWEDLE